MSHAFGEALAKKGLSIDELMTPSNAPGATSQCTLDNSNTSTELTNAGTEQLKIMRGARLNQFLKGLTTYGGGQPSNTFDKVEPRCRKKRRGSK